MDEKNNLNQQIIINISEDLDKLCIHDISKENNKIIIINKNSDFGDLLKYYVTLSDKIYIVKGTKIKTDQGIILIENLDINKNTINNKKILSISNILKTKNKSLILFEKDCLEKGIPDEDTYIHSDQKILFKNELIEAKLFLFKYSIKNIQVVNINDKIFYNILLFGESNISLNNIIIYYSESNQKQIYNNLKEKRKLEDNWKNLNNDELWFHWENYGKYDNKKMYFKLDFYNSDLIQYKNKYSDLKNKNLNMKQLWIHWVENGKKEGRKLIYKINKENANLDDYRLSYKDLFNKTYEELWEHWLYHGKNEDRNMNYKITFNNADLDKYREDNIDLIKKNKKELWDHYIKIGKIENRKIYFKINIDNADLERYKKDYLI